MHLQIYIQNQYSSIHFAEHRYKLLSMSLVVLCYVHLLRMTYTATAYLISFVRDLYNTLLYTHNYIVYSSTILRFASFFYQPPKIYATFIRYKLVEEERARTLTFSVLIDTINKFKYTGQQVTSAPYTVQ